jgi:hypothetical protein
MYKKIPERARVTPIDGRDACKIYIAHIYNILSGDCRKTHWYMAYY